MLYAMYFSPNGTTLKTLKNIVSGMGQEAIYIDMTNPENRKKEYNFSKEDTVLYGTITAAMLFATNKEIFSRLNGNGARFIGVAMYGNGYYGVALKQLRDRATKRGFKVVAVAAFIGRHAQGGTASGRPDEKDIEKQISFGKSVAGITTELHKKIPVGWATSPLYNTIVCARLFMQGQDYTLPAFLKTKEANGCVGCGTCERNCPVGAIKMTSAAEGKKPVFDSKKCIACYRCIGNCPEKAITCTSKVMNGIGKDFGSKFSKRIEPTICMDKN